MKTIRWALGSLFGIVLLTLAVWVFIAGPVTVYRVIRFGDTQIDDFEHYPARRLQPGPNPSPFLESQAGGRIPETVSLTNGEHANLRELLASNDTIAFLIVQEDMLLFEEYGQGHTQSSLSQSFSMAKSFTSALVGAAVQDGLIRSVDQPVTDFIPELAGRGFEQVTVRHLLTMTSGSSYIENDNPFGIHVILNYTPELEERILSFQVRDEPGTVFRYKSGDNALLALILARALHPRTISDYTQEKLWTPLGMEYEGLWSLDREGGLEKTWCCLAAAARDFAKLGRLYLQDGHWQGARMFSPEWVEQSTQAGVIPEAGWPEDFRAIGVRNYGYQWWLLSEEEGDFLAQGKDGQFLYVNPARNVIIVRLGWSTGEMPLSQWIGLFQQLSQAATSAANSSGSATRAMTCPACTVSPA